MISKSYIDHNTEVFSIEKKIGQDELFNRLVDLLKNQPGDLTAPIVEMKKYMDEMFITGSTLSTRYYAAKVDLETIRDQSRIIETENKKLNDIIRAIYADPKG